MVARFKIVAVDRDALQATIEMQTCLQGAWTNETVTQDGKKEGLPFDEIMFEDVDAVAFMGSKGRQANRVLLYMGGTLGTRGRDARVCSLAISSAVDGVEHGRIEGGFAFCAVRMVGGR